MQIYHFFVTKNITKINYKQGELSELNIVYSNFPYVSIYGKTLTEAFDEICNKLFGQTINYNECRHINETNKVIYKRLETASGVIPTDQEYQQYQQGELDLNCANYIFEVMSLKPVSEEEIITCFKKS